MDYDTSKDKRSENVGLITITTTTTTTTTTTIIIIIIIIISEINYANALIYVLLTFDLPISLDHTTCLPGRFQKLQSKGNSKSSRRT